MDKSWMVMDRRSIKFRNGLEAFFKFSVDNGINPMSMNCPCIKCGNLETHTVEEIRGHVFFNGIDSAYRDWIWHVKLYQLNINLLMLGRKMSLPI